MKYLFVNSFCMHIKFFYGTFNSQEISITKLVFERHQDESEQLFTHVSSHALILEIAL
jgi:hypothetical protein